MLKLYSGTRNASSWAMRAWLALHEAGVPFEEEIVDIRRPQRFDNLARIGRFSPAAMVPVLLADGAAVFDSLAIMEYANDRAGGALLPADSIARARARSIVAWQHGGLSSICARISFESAFYPFRRALDVTERSEAGRLFAEVERLLAAHDGPYLFGDHSLADIALTPAAIRLASHDADGGAWPAARGWMGRVIARPLVQRWLADAVSLPPVWDESYLVPGRAPVLAARTMDLLQPAEAA